MTGFTERSCLWYLTINVGIGTENRTKHLVGHILKVARLGAGELER